MIESTFILELVRLDIFTQNQIVIDSVKVKQRRLLELLVDLFTRRRSSYFQNDFILEILETFKYLFNNNFFFCHHVDKKINLTDFKEDGS